MSTAEMTVYRNARGGLYAVVDRVKADAAADGGTRRIWWVPCYKAPGAANWVKVPGAKWHHSLSEAQAELDKIAQDKQLIAARQSEASE